LPSGVTFTSILTTTACQTAMSARCQLTQSSRDVMLGP
jgi:hypothetical protein